MNKSSGRTTSVRSSAIQSIASSFTPRRKVILFLGDCRDLLRSMPTGSVDLTVTSPPYCMGREYENTYSLRDFIDLHREVIPEVLRVTKRSGSICWQVGYHVTSVEVTPLDVMVYQMFQECKGSDDIKLRNRIVWAFGHGLHAARRFSGRHEMVLWFTKSDDYYFDLDSVRTPQKYPGKKHHKGTKRGQYSGNPLGKNPEDVWFIPNVKFNHVEKTDHPCQFPVGLVQRLVRALSPVAGRVLDPFAGSGTTGATAYLEGRRFVGAERDPRYHRTAARRVQDAIAGTLRYRDADRPICEPDPRTEVARRPPHFKG